MPHTRHTLRLLTLVSALAIAGATLVAPAAASRLVTRPFHAELTGAANITGALSPCTFINQPTAVGVARHLGRVTFTAYEVIDACPPGPSTVDSTFTLIAANGDLLHGQLTDVVITVHDDGSAIAEGPYQLVGGTGRFAGASGEGTWTVEFNEGIGFGAPAHVTAHGTITY